MPKRTSTNLTKVMLEHIVNDAHARLDVLMVARGDAYGAFSLSRRIEELARYGADMPAKQAKGDEVC